MRGVALEADAVNSLPLEDPLSRSVAPFACGNLRRAKLAGSAELSAHPIKVPITKATTGMIAGFETLIARTEFEAPVHEYARSPHGLLRRCEPWLLAIARSFYLAMLARRLGHWL